MKIIKIIFVNLILYIYFICNYTFAQELTPEQIYEKVNDCVVVILSYEFDGKLKKQGSGVVINDSGWIITNYHVFAECERIEIKHNETYVKYNDIIGVDVEKDILILKINDNLFSSIRLGNSDNLKVGQRIYTVGSPLGYENSISEGIISGIRNIDEKNRNYIQITASISPGSSGGAVVNSYGELIGISTMTAKDGQNLNFAIPINDIMKVSISSYKDKNKIEANNYFFKGINAAKSGNYADAIIYYTKYLEIFPDNEKVFYNRGNSYDKLKEYSKALSDYTKAIEINPKYTEAYNNRGTIYNDLKEYTKAISDYTQAININPKTAIPYNNRGIVYYKLKEYKNALSDYTKAIDINPNYTEAYYGRGNIYYDENNYSKAISEYSKAIEIDSEFADAYYYRGICYFKTGDKLKACKDWEKANSLGLNDSKIALYYYCK